MLSLKDQIREIYFKNKEKDLYINNIEWIDLISTTKYIKKANRENMNLENI